MSVTFFIITCSKELSVLAVLSGTGMYLGQRFCPYLSGIIIVMGVKNNIFGETVAELCILLY